MNSSIMVDDAHTAPLIVFAGGGTGGHLYPALAVADALSRRLPGVRFQFFGTRRHIDQRALTGTEVQLIQQDLAPIRYAPWCWPGVYLSFRRTSGLCRLHFQSDRPAVVIGTGGLSSVPVVREAARAGIPTVLLNPDLLPGRANRYLASRADIVFAQWDETTQRFPRSTRVVACGCPVRTEFNKASRREAGTERFGLDVGRKTLLVTGASQGARTLNRAVLACLEYLESSWPDWQVLHLTGDHDYDEVRDAYGHRSIRASVLSFTEHMADALRAADLVIARAGASFLAELTAVARPSILMPYPYHRDRHQVANARRLVSAAAGRIVYDRIDPALNGPLLREALQDLLANDELREAMAVAAGRMGRGKAASEIADRIIGLAGAHGKLLPAAFRDSASDF